MDGETEVKRVHLSIVTHSRVICTLPTLLLLSALGDLGHTRLFRLLLLTWSWALLCLGMENADDAVSTRDPLARPLSAEPQGQLKETVERRCSKFPARNEDVRVHL